jgi:hypothetical protein
MTKLGIDIGDSLKKKKKKKTEREEEDPEKG